jgi:Major Facilitator Superfamily/Cyclic nucleotide-binding domain
MTAAASPALDPAGNAGRLAALANRNIRSLELAWTLGVAADWALLVVALLVAYDAGGAVAVGLVSVARMIPATIANVVVDTGILARPERALVGVHLARGAGAALVAVAIVADQPVLAFVAVAGAAAAGALVRPTTLALLPAVAATPDELVSANTMGAIGESFGTFAGPLLASLVIARSGAAPASALAALSCVAAGVIALGVRVADASRPRRRDRPSGLPLVAGIRELVARPPAGVLMTSFFVQTVVRGALTTYLAVLAIEVLDLGDSGVGLLGTAIGVGGILGALGTLSRHGRRLAPLFAVALVAWGAPIAVIGLVPGTAVALVALAVVGVGNALIDVSGLTLLQRGTSNRARTGVFATLEVGASAGVSVGGVVGSALIAGLGIRFALVATGLALPLVAAIGWRWVRRLDSEAVVPEHQASLLRGVPLFATMPLAALEQVAAGMRQVSYAPGEVLMTQGVPGDTYVILETGRVEVEVDGRPGRQLGPGEGLGEIALLRAVPRTATVTAVEPVTGWSVDCETFVAAVSGHDPSAAAAHAVVEARLGADHGRLPPTLDGPSDRAP